MHLLERLYCQILESLSTTPQIISVAAHRLQYRKPQMFLFIEETPLVSVVKVLRAITY